MIIDIHSHIIPKVDDGAKSMEQALLMLKMAAMDGIEHTILTPHLLNNGELVDFNNVKKAFDELCLAKDNENIPINIYMGCEAPLVINKLADALSAGIVPTLAGSEFVLVEFYQHSITFSTESIIRSLIEKGFKPIIAHPERCIDVGKKLKDLKKLVGLGAFLQINADSLMYTEKNLSKVSLAFIKEGLASFIASDAHGISVRKPILSNCKRYVSEQFGSKTAEDIFVNNPAKIIGL